MTSPERLRRLVDFALPKPCEFGEENFAGDPLVRAFCDLVRQRHQLDIHVFVSWACPPDVKVLQPRRGGASAIIRSERLDTLLIEYYHLRRIHHLWESRLTRNVSTAGVLQWMCEFLIGYRQPELAVLAQTLRPDIEGIHLTNPFRDETLASLPDLERAALQCFSLGHEVGHLLIPKRKDASLDVVVDGLSLGQHARTQEQQEGALLEGQLARLAEVRERELDAANLLNEVQVDLFAFGTVVDFLTRAFDCPIQAAVEAALLSFECQSFVYGCKGTCLLLARAAKGELNEEGFRRQDYLIGVEIVVRARAVARRAGLVWAVAEHPTPPTGGRDYNTYVNKIDALIGPTTMFRSLMADVLSEQAYTILGALDENTGTRRETWLDALLCRVEQDSQLRLNLFFILIAFGCSGAVDSLSYLRQMRSTV